MGKDSIGALGEIRCDNRYNQDIVAGDIRRFIKCSVEEEQCKRQGSYLEVRWS